MATLCRTFTHPVFEFIQPLCRCRRMSIRCGAGDRHTHHPFSRGSVRPSPVSSPADARQWRPGPDLNPYEYTSGGWLRNDRQQRQSRTLIFDLPSLSQRVVEVCRGATSITHCEKKEGGHNRVFVFTCDNAKRIIARLPMPMAGPPRLTTNSEVATITYSKLQNPPFASSDR